MPCWKWRAEGGRVGGKGREAGAFPVSGCCVNHDFCDATSANQYDPAF